VIRTAGLVQTLPNAYSMYLPRVLSVEWKDVVKEIQVAESRPKGLHRRGILDHLLRHDELPMQNCTVEVHAFVQRDGVPRVPARNGGRLRGDVNLPRRRDPRPRARGGLCSDGPTRLASRQRFNGAQRWPLNIDTKRKIAVHTINYLT
jgi:hypothetical protein